MVGNPHGQRFGGNRCSPDAGLQAVREYSVQLTELGLRTDSPWTVVATGGPASNSTTATSTQTNLTLILANGSYTINASAPGFVAGSGPFQITINGVGTPNTTGPVHRGPDDWPTAGDRRPRVRPLALDWARRSRRRRSGRAGRYRHRPTGSTPAPTERPRRLNTVLRLTPSLLATSVGLPLNGSRSTYRLARAPTARGPRTRASSIRLARFPSRTKFSLRAEACRRTARPSKSKTYFRSRCRMSSPITNSQRSLTAILPLAPGSRRWSPILGSGP